MSKEINQLPAASSVTGTDETAVDQAGVAKRATFTQIKDYVKSVLGLTKSDLPSDVTTDLDANTTHRTSDGKDHSDVVLNNTHRTGDGSDHADVAANSAFIANVDDHFDSADSYKLKMFDGVRIADLLAEWADGQNYELTAITRDSDGVITTATVKWPDGSAGTFTTTTKNTTWGAIDAYTITHTDSGLTITQSAVTRNANGEVTAKPAITIAQEK